MANAHNSDSESEEYFPMLLPTLAVMSSLPQAQSQEGELLPSVSRLAQVSDLEGVSALEGRARPLSPPVLLLFSTSDLEAAVELVRLPAHHGILPSKVS